MWTHAGDGDELAATVLGMARGLGRRIVPDVHEYETVFMESLDVRTAFDVGQPRIVEKIFLTMDGKGNSGMEGSLTKGSRCWWRDKHIYHARSVPFPTNAKGWFVMCGL